MKERFVRQLDKERGRILEIPYICGIATQEAAVDIYSDNKVLQAGLSEELANFQNVIPGFRVEGEPTNSQCSLYVLEHNETGLYYDEKIRRAYLFGRPTDFIDGQAIAWVSYWMMEQQKQEKSYFTMHSSALTINGKGILLLGQSGAGKTSLMLNLCQKYPSTVISNDLTVVRHDPQSRKMFLIDGTKEIRLRLASVEKNFPNLRYLFPGNNASAWESKVVVSPEGIGLKSESGTPEIHSVFEVYLDSKGTDDLSIKQEKEIPIRYKLYEDMSRIVRGSAISVFDGKQKFLGYMPSLDSDKIHDNRVSCIEEMVDNIGVISVSGGNIEEVTEAIYKLASR